MSGPAAAEDRDAGWRTDCSNLRPEVCQAGVESGAGHRGGGGPRGITEPHPTGLGEDGVTGRARAARRPFPPDRKLLVTRRWKPGVLSCAK